MSVLRTDFAKEAPSARAYHVAAPCRSDVLTATLRSAYTNDEPTEPFADLMVLLDRIELPHRI